MDVFYLVYITSSMLPGISYSTSFLQLRKVRKQKNSILAKFPVYPQVHQRKSKTSIKMHNLLPLALALLSLGGSSLGCSTIGGVKLTDYGYPDTPPPHQPAFKCHGNNVVPTQPGDKPELGNVSSTSRCDLTCH